MTVFIHQMWVLFTERLHSSLVYCFIICDANKNHVLFFSARSTWWVILDGVFFFADWLFNHQLYPNLHFHKRTMLTREPFLLRLVARGTDKARPLSFIYFMYFQPCLSKQCTLDAAHKMLPEQTQFTLESCWLVYFIIFLSSFSSFRKTRTA